MSTRTEQVSEWNVAGRTVVITGPTAGIGRETARQLAALGADLVLVARNPAKAQVVEQELRAVAGHGDVTVVEGDLASLTSVRRAAGEVARVAERVDVLIDNAGMAARQHRSTDDGFDEMLATNYLGPFLFTHLLLPRLRASAPARIVVVGSEAHRFTGGFDAEHFPDFGEYHGLAAQRAYGRTKLLDMLFADELARRLQGTGVTVNSLCPGMVGTELGREVGLAGGVLRLGMATRLVRTPARGAHMSVRLASSPTVDGVTGHFFTSTAAATVLPKAHPRRDPAVAKRVYERTCELVGIEPLAASPGA